MLKHLSSLLVFQISISECLEARTDPWSRGPYSTEHKLYFPQLNAGLDHQVDVWAPDAAGTFPIVYNFGGLGSILPGDVYSDTMKQVASHGIVVVQAWALFSTPATNYQAEWV